MEVVGWLESLGGKVSPNLQVRHSKDQGNYIVGSFLPGELLVQVPANLLINIKTLKVADQSHMNLAAYLYNTHNTWTDSIPPVELPLEWPKADIQRLPLKYKARVLEQQQQIKDQFETLGLEDYKRWVWAWSSVNSRCLYWDVGLEREGQMTLAPLIDFFNHSTDPKNCITIKEKLGKMSAYAPLEPTPELNLFYGPHENGFLLVEYGFVPSNNQFDHIDITEEIKQLQPDLEALDDLGYLGNYTLGQDGPCFRSMVALGSIGASRKQIKRYSQGIDDIPCLEHLLAPLYSRLKQRYVAIPSDRPEIQTLYREYQRILESNT